MMRKSLTNIRIILISSVMLLSLNGCFNIKERKLKKEIDSMEHEYERITREIDSIDKKIDQFKERDSILMMQLLQDTAYNNNQ